MSIWEKISQFTGRIEEVKDDLETRYAGPLLEKIEKKLEKVKETAIGEKQGKELEKESTQEMLMGVGKLALGMGKTLLRGGRISYSAKMDGDKAREHFEHAKELKKEGK